MNTTLAPTAVANAAANAATDTAGSTAFPRLRLRQVAMLGLGAVFIADKGWMLLHTVL